ncbi:hypothetical protein AUJ14_04385 [Candidatus Micrarchaeota archaeon CG1_02_55_22]|nr:MAG: hypothetical protein AUJ14_04385 [Candidatus Micrarchaeota archaeon CG1_02_55_22]
MPNEIRLVGFDARPFRIGKPSPLARRRLEAAKREVEGARKVALPIVGEKSLVRLAREASRHEELDEADRERISSAAVQYAENEVHPPIPLTRLARQLSGIDTLTQFNNAVLAGYFGDLAALHSHAEEHGTQIVALESAQIRQQIRTPKSERETSQTPTRSSRQMSRNKEIRGEARRMFEALGGLEPKRGLEPEEKRLQDAAREIARKKPETVIADASIYRHVSGSKHTAISKRRVIASPLQRVRFGL